MVTAMKRRADAGPILATALLVCAAYYVGANVGFILRFPPATPSLLWPPNSILTATLLLSAPRRWGIYLLAALPAHLVAELGVFPFPLVLAIVVLITGAPAWIRRAPLRNKAEAVLLTAGLLGSLVAVFVEPQAGAYPIPGVPVPPLTFIVPFVLWAALRFGSSGASLSLLASVLVAICAATHGRGSFPLPLLAESVLALQIVVSILAIPLMYLSTLT